MLARLPDAFGLERTTRYFTVATLIFILSYLVLPSSKMVNNVFYVLVAIPALLIGARCIVGHRPSWIGGLWLIFLGYFAARGVIEGDLGFVKHVGYVAVFVLVLGCLVSRRFYQQGEVIRLLFWSAVGYVVLNALWLWISGSVAVGDRILWLSGRMAGPIYTSMWIAVCFGLCVPVWMSENRRGETVLGILAAFFVCGYVLQSRSGLVGLFVSLLILMLIASTNSRSVRRVTLLGFSGLAIALFILMSQIPVLSTLLARGDSYRFELWERYADALRECGLWQGCGIDYSPAIQLADGMLINHPHNIYLSLAMYGGLPGAILFGAIMSAALLNAARTQNIWGIALLLGLIMVNFDGHKVLDSPNELWLLLLLPAGLVSATINERPCSLHWKPQERKLS